MESMNTIINMIALGFGVYSLYVVWKLGPENKLFPNGLLVPKDRTVEECLDSESYVQYMKPRTVALGIVLVLEGLFAILNETLGLLVRWFGELSSTMNLLLLEIPIIIALVVIIWYSVVLVKAQKMYWP